MAYRRCVAPSVKIARLCAAATNLVLKPFQEAADRVVDLLCGGPKMERKQIFAIESEVKAAF
jgi:hypothetical protein